MLLAGGIELGRSIFVSQVLHEAARVAAREFSVTPMSADCVFENALANLCGADVQANIWNPNLLVIDVACNPSPDQLKGFVDNLPLLNRALTPVFIYDNVVAAGTERKLLRYPGALLGVIAHDPPTLGCPQAATDLTVAVPRVRDRTATLDPVTGVRLARKRSIGFQCLGRIGELRRIQLRCIQYGLSGSATSRLRAGLQPQHSTSWNCDDHP